MPALSTSNSVLQVERGHPSWQNPHGTKSHDPHPIDTLGASLGSIDGAMVVGMLLGDEEGANDACPVGSLLVPGSLLQIGWKPGLPVPSQSKRLLNPPGQTTSNLVATHHLVEAPGYPGRQSAYQSQGLPELCWHLCTPARKSALSNRSAEYKSIQADWDSCIPLFHKQVVHRLAG